MAESHTILTASVPITTIPLFLRNKLHPLLPYSLPLYRRCQFFLHECRRLQPAQARPSGQPGEPELYIAVSVPKQGDGAEARDQEEWFQRWLGTVEGTPSSSSSSSSSSAVAVAPLETETKSEPVSNNNDNPKNLPSSTNPWCVSHIDLREPGQTQIWFFGSWEAQVPPQPPIPPSLPTRTQKLLARNLFTHLRTHHIPTLPATPSPQYLAMKAAGKIVSTPYRRTKVLFGSIAESSYWILDRDIVLSSSSSSSTSSTVIVREDRPYLKYILPLPLPPPPTSTSSSQQDGQQRQKFRTGPLQTPHLQTMLDRSVIPRSLELLQTLVSTGLFTDGGEAPSNPVAWGILSKDASLSSLHTEPEYRGRGLAERVARTLVGMTGARFRTGNVNDGQHDEKSIEEGGTDEDREVAWAHTDVSPANMASRRVFEKMGAKVGWEVGWVEIDVDGGLRS